MNSNEFKSGGVITEPGPEVTFILISNSVLQPWVEKIPMRMQSTLLLSLRGPDTHTCPEIKRIIRWMRGLTYKPGNPDNVAEFMGEKPERILEKGPTAKELEFCSVHFYSHLMHGLEVIGYRHPNDGDMYHAQLLYGDMSRLLHLDMEDVGDFEDRLGNKEWPGGVQPNNYEEAMKMIGRDKAPFDKCGSASGYCHSKDSCKAFGHCRYHAVFDGMPVSGEGRW